MVLALSELIAARNCTLQSEKSMLAAGWLEDELPEAELPDAELLAAELAELAGGVARSVEVQAGVTSSSIAAASTDRRVLMRVESTP
ncbi:MAG: hypothetical protein ABI047_00510 [Jatrophihabitantaceae bacterium]